MTLHQLDRSLGHAELVRWMAYDLVEPIGQRRTDDGFRLIAWMLYSANRAKDAPELSPDDFMKTWEPPVDAGEAAAMLLAVLERRAKP